MTRAPLTTLIIARNAAATIGRAVTSVLQAGPQWPILLVDDWSDDGTADVARSSVADYAAAHGGDYQADQLSVIRPAIHRGTGYARQTALDHVQTPFAVWLDADDAILPARQEAVLRELVDHGADMVVHEVQLRDGPTGSDMGALPIPDFLDHGEPSGLAWQWERNWLPFLGVAFRVSSARQAGYDGTLTACEDYDHFLRVLARHQHIRLKRQVLLDHYAYAGSVSRQIDHHRSQLQQVYQRWQGGEAVSQSDIPAVQKLWMTASAALYAGRDTDSLAALDEINSLDLDGSEIAAPYARPYSLLVGYLRAVLAFRRGHTDQALDLLKAGLEQNDLQADYYGALAYGYGLQDMWDQGLECGQQALALKADYFDAQATVQALENQQKTGLRLTQNPLRHYQVRSTYD